MLRPEPGHPGRCAGCDGAGCLGERGGELPEGPGGAAQERRDIVGDPFGVAETDAQARALIVAGFGQWSAAISDGLRRLHDTGQLPTGTDPDDLAVTLLAALQGGLLLAQVQRDTRPLETALDTLLDLAGISHRDAPRGETRS